jgi:predicted phage terminase large subunit-like protein
MTSSRPTSLKIKSLYDIWAFADLIDFRGGQSSFSAIHRKMAGFITAPQSAKACKNKAGRHQRYNRRRLVEVPRGHLKSSIGSVLYILWRIYRNPNIRVLYGTNVIGLSEQFIRELRHYFEDEDLQETVWNARPHIPGRLIPMLDGQGKRAKRKTTDGGDYDPSTEASDRKIKWTNQAIQVLRSSNLKEPTVLSTSTGSKVTGQHYDLLILDDIVDFDNTRSRQQIEKLFEWVQDMESVVDPERKDVFCGKAGVAVLTENVGDEVLISGTRYARNDYYEYIENNKRDLEYVVFKRNIYRNGVDADKGYLWPEKFTAEYVTRLRKRLTSRRWASQYLNSISVANGDMILNRERVHWIHNTCVKPDGSGLVYVEGNKEMADMGVQRLTLRAFMILDPAISQAKLSDNTCIVVGAVDDKSNTYILDARYGKFLPTKVATMLQELASKWGVYSVSIENNGIGGSYGYSLKQHFKGQRPLMIREHRAGVGNRFGISGDKKTRIENRIQPLLENGQLWMADFLLLRADIMDEFDLFPQRMAHDDFLDCVDQLSAIARAYSKNDNKRGIKRTSVNRKYGGTR